MTSAEIFAHYSGTDCIPCSGFKQKQKAFCVSCYMRLPNLLRSSLWKKFGNGFEEAYQGCLSWFRLHPVSAASPYPVRRGKGHVVRQPQASLFGKEHR